MPGTAWLDLILFLSPVLSAALAAYAVRHRTARGATALGVLLAAIAVWSAFYALEILAAGDLPRKVFWAGAKYIGVATVPLAWLAFALEDTFRDKWLTRRNVVLLCLVPSLTILLALTNSAHHFMWSNEQLVPAGPFTALQVTFGPWFWLHTVYSYILLLAGGALIVHSMLNSNLAYRGQTSLLVVALVVPWVGNVITIFRLSAIPNLDLTPFAFTVTGFALAWDVLRVQLLDLLPVARSAVFENLADGVIVLDMQNRIADLNPAGRRILNPWLKPVGQPVSQLAPEWLARFFESQETQAEVVMGEGEAKLAFDLALSPLLDQSGRPSGRLLVLRDISQRKRVDEDRQRLMYYPIRLYQVLRIVTSELNPDAVAGAAVEAVARVAGWPNVSLMTVDKEKQHLVLLAAAGQVSSEVDAKLPIDCGIIGRAFRTGQPQYVPDVTLDPDYVSTQGGVRSKLAIPLLRQEQTLGVLDLESDQVDAFKPADQLLAESLADAITLALNNALLHGDIDGERSRLQSVIRASQSGIMLADVDGRLVVANERALDLLRLSGQPDDWLGRPAGEALEALRTIAPAAVEAIMAELCRVDAGDEPPVAGEFEVLPRQVRWQTVPVMAGARPLGRLLMLRDVTEERAVIKMRDTMTHTMVHDLRSPLANINVALGLILDERLGSLNDGQRNIVGIAAGSTRSMLDLVTAILDVSRLEAGQMPLDRKNIDAGELVKEVCETQSSLAAEKHIALEQALPPDAPQVWADNSLLRRVLQNLVGNSLKFTPNDGRVRVSLETNGSGPGVLLFTVSDTGPGIPADLRDRLFQKFVTGRVPERGSGLGLAFCRLAVEAMGGRIWQEDAPEGGSIFTFTLPTANGA